MQCVGILRVSPTLFWHVVVKNGFKMVFCCVFHHWKKKENSLLGKRMSAFRSQWLCQRNLDLCRYKCMEGNMDVDYMDVLLPTWWGGITKGPSSMGLADSGMPRLFWGVRPWFLEHFVTSLNALHKSHNKSEESHNKLKNVSFQSEKKWQTHLFETEGGFAQNLTQDNSQSEGSIPSCPNVPSKSNLFRELRKNNSDSTSKSSFDTVSGFGLVLV